MTVSGEPRESSPAVKDRPIAGFTPKMGDNALGYPEALDFFRFSKARH